MLADIRKQNKERILSQNRTMLDFVDDFFNNGFVPATVGTYPPHNVIRVDDNKLRVELAVAGFNREELSVTLEKNVLVVRGEQKRDEDASVIYHHKGISTKTFEKKWKVIDWEVSEVLYRDGILSIELFYEVPEEEKPKQFEIK